MNSRLKKITEKKQQLIIEATSQRLKLTQYSAPLKTPLAMADKALIALRYIKHHPTLGVLGSTALLSIAKPSRILRWSNRIWVVWGTLKRFRNK